MKRCPQKYLPGCLSRHAAEYRVVVVGLICLVGAVNVAEGATWYCDPSRGMTATQAGTQEDPWGMLQAVVEARKFVPTTKIQDGDTVKLLSGYHGIFSTAIMRGAERTRVADVTVEAADGATPRLAYLDIRASQHWVFRRLHISPSFASPSLVVPRPPDEDLGGPQGMIRGGSASLLAHYITIEDCQLFTVDDASGWTRTDWTMLTWDGVSAYITNGTIRRNTIRNVARGIIVGPGTLVEGNTIRGWAHDGIFWGGANITIQDNILQDVYGNDSSCWTVPSRAWHADSIQGGQGIDGSNVIIRRNYICARTDPSRPATTIGGLQGIFLENNPLTGLIENNVVLSLNAVHGITIGAASGFQVHDLIIRNNTILNPYGLGGNHPDIHYQWQSTFYNLVIVNNIAGEYPGPNAAANIVASNNVSANSLSPNAIFVDYPHGNVRLASAAASLIDAGNNANGAGEDADRAARPVGDRVDIGAYEYGSGGPGNHAPILRYIDNQEVTVGASLSVEVTASDADGDTLTYSISGQPATAVFEGQTLRWTPAADEVGTYSVTFTVSDGQAQASQTITVTVRAPNAPPVLGSIGDWVVPENQLLSFSISATDPEGDPITYSAAGLPSGASFVGQTFTWTPTHTQVGSYSVTFAASDGRTQVTQAAMITVSAVDQPPVLAAIGDKLVDENSTLTFDISATDEDQDTLMYSATGLPSGADFTVRTFTWAPGPGQAGSYEVTFVASDGRLTDSETIRIIVASVAPDTDAPVVAQLAPAADAIQVPLNNLVTLHVTDGGSGVDVNGVTIALNGNTIYQGDQDTYASSYGRCTRSGTRNDYRFTYQNDAMFDFDQAVAVTIRAADRAGNVMEGYTYSFVTEMRSFSSNKLVGKDAASSSKRGPVTAGDAAGNTWVAWQAGPDNARDIYVAKMVAGADAFGTPTRLTADARDQCHPDLAIGPDGSVYVVWQDNRNGNWDIYASIGSGDRFSRAVPVTNSTKNETNPSVALDGQSPACAWVAWQDDRNGNQDIYVAGSSNAFLSNTAAQVTTDTANQMQPDITVDAQNTVCIVWTDLRNGQTDLYGAVSNSGPWTNVPVATGSGDQTDPVITAQPGSSILHLAWVDATPGNRDIYYAQLDGLPSTPVIGSSIVDDTSSADQTSPTLACHESGKVFACWQDPRHVGADGTDSDLYFAELSEGTVKTNVLVGDGGTNASQSEPALGVDAWGQPYVVWTDDRNTDPGVYFAATTFVDPTPLDSEMVLASAGAVIGAEPTAIQTPGDVSIVVPPGACPTNVRMAIWKVINPQVAPVACLGSYDFGPSGIDFAQPVTVTIPYRITGNGRARAYWYDALTGMLSQQGITNVENITLASNLSALRFQTTHFTPFYIVASDSDTSASTVATVISGGGCSLSPTGGGSPRDLLIPYTVITAVVIALRRKDRKKLAADKLIP